MNVEEIPSDIKKLVDDRAGKVHSNTGLVMTTLAEALTMMEQKLRVALAFKIRSELVCCNMYDKVQEIDKAMRANGDRLWNAEDIVGYHGICHWGEAAARIVELTPNSELFNSQVQHYLNQLDGTAKSAVKLLTGLSEEELDELGGMDDTKGTD